MADDGGQSRPSGLQLFHGKAVLVFSIAASVWAGLTGGLDYWRDYLAEQEAERQAQATAVADVSRVLGVMRFNCDKDFKGLVFLADKLTESEPRAAQMRVCYGAFSELTSLVYQAAVKIQQPSSLSEAQWRGYWASFAKGVTDIADDGYSAVRVDCPWRKIAESTNAVLHSTVCPEEN